MLTLDVDVIYFSNFRYSFTGEDKSLYLRLMSVIKMYYNMGGKY